MSQPTAYHAIADDNRRKILDLLRTEGPLRAGEIVNRLSHISQPAVSKHLRVLRQAKLVRAEQSGRERSYSLSPASLRSIAEWLAHYERLWDTRLETLKQLAEQTYEQARPHESLRAPIPGSPHQPFVDEHLYHGPFAVAQPLYR